MLNPDASIDLLLGVINRASDRWPPNLPYSERWWGTSKSWASTDHQTVSKRTAEAKLGGALTGFCITWTIEMDSL